MHRGVVCLHGACTAPARCTPCPAICVQVAVTGHAWKKHGACKKQRRACMVHAVRVSTQFITPAPRMRGAGTRIAALAVRRHGAFRKGLFECRKQARRGRKASPRRRFACGLHAWRWQCGIPVHSRCMQGAGSARHSTCPLRTRCWRPAFTRHAKGMRDLAFCATVQAPPVRPMMNSRQIEALIRRARTIGPVAYTEPDATTWIWSDLHLGHEHSRTVFERDRSRRRPPSTRR